jgi:hypothetical protein
LVLHLLPQMFFALLKITQKGSREARRAGLCPPPKVARLDALKLTTLCCQFSSWRLPLCILSCAKMGCGWTPCPTLWAAPRAVGAFVRTCLLSCVSVWVFVLVYSLLFGLS